MWTRAGLAGIEFRAARNLTESPRSTDGIRRGRWRNGLIIGEVALSVVLLIGAGLMIHSFDRLLTQNLGFNPRQVVTMEINLPEKKYPKPSDARQLFDQLLARVRALPAVIASGGVFGLPLSGGIEGQDLELVGAPPLKPGELLTADYAQVSPGYFAAMNIPLRSGRDFTERDATNAPMVLIVNETFIRQFHLGTNVLGRRLKTSDSGGESEIIGVVSDVKSRDLALPSRGAMYRSYRQVCRGRMTLVVRTQREPSDLSRAVRAELDQLDKDLALENVGTMTQLVQSSVSQRKLQARLLGGFAGVALVLAAIGLYGVLAHAVTQRTREMGIRTALGAQSRDLLGLVVGQAARLVVAGTVFGLAAACALARVLERLLYEIKPTDPLTFIAMPLVVAAVALLACWLPARRATRVDPMVALRYE